MRKCLQGLTHRVRRLLGFRYYPKPDAFAGKPPAQFVRAHALLTDLEEDALEETLYQTVDEFMREIRELGFRRPEDDLRMSEFVGEQIRLAVRLYLWNLSEARKEFARRMMGGG